MKPPTNIEKNQEECAKCGCQKGTHPIDVCKEFVSSKQNQEWGKIKDIISPAINSYISVGNNIDDEFIGQDAFEPMKEHVAKKVATLLKQERNRMVEELKKEKEKCEYKKDTCHGECGICSNNDLIEKVIKKLNQ